MPYLKKHTLIVYLLPPVTNVAIAVSRRGETVDTEGILVGGDSGCSYVTKTSHGSRCICESVHACVDARLGAPGCDPLTDGAAAGTWRGEMDASGLHGGDLVVGLARMLL